MIRPAASVLATPLLHHGVLRDRPVGQLVGDPVGSPETPLDADTAIAEGINAAAPDGAGVGAVVAPKDVTPEASGVHAFFFSPVPPHAMQGSSFGQDFSHSCLSRQT